MMIPKVVSLTRFTIVVIQDVVELSDVLLRVVGLLSMQPIFQYTTHGVTRDQQFFIRRNDVN